MTTTGTEALKISKIATMAITYVLPVFGLAVPLLYFVGRVRTEVYWTQMQVPTGIMTYGFEDYVYTGFVAIAIAVVEIFSWAPLGPLGAWLIAVLLSALLIALSVGARRWFGHWLKNKALQLEAAISTWRKDKSHWKIQFAVPFFWVFERLCNLFLMILLPLLLVISVIVWADRSGKRIADDDLKSLRSGKVSGGDARALMHVDMEGDALVGVAVGCAGDWCAMTKEGDVVVVPKTSIVRIDHCPKTIKLASGGSGCHPKETVSP
ncbi:hypothetical protein J2X02_000301 [Pseudoxanthomonas japonensis]|uniref:hypothetical protein n=1 Tax=Pseudoxanthomonas japonensis TaxID=69284 RepID=UPI00285724F3|nr:hypothetical protein [Pseudoxanthomonas japonensis]MDR7067484.1 hypothetical protein [Pseudoxanthomonas japonensis]